jgi:hypothetical protein
MILRLFLLALAVISLVRAAIMSETAKYMASHVNFSVTANEVVLINSGNGMYKTTNNMACQSLFLSVSFVSCFF